MRTSTRRRSRRFTRIGDNDEEGWAAAGWAFERGNRASPVGLRDPAKYTTMIFKLKFTRDDVTSSGLRLGEGAAFELEAAARLIARGVAALAPGEEETPELRASIARALRPAAGHWMMPLVGPRWPGWHEQ
jgi:hypothetical protein